MSTPETPRLRPLAAILADAERDRNCGDPRLEERASDVTALAALCTRLAGALREVNDGAASWGNPEAAWVGRVADAALAEYDAAAKCDND